MLREVDWQYFGIIISKVQITSFNNHYNDAKYRMKKVAR